MNRHTIAVSVFLLFVMTTAARPSDARTLLKAIYTPVAGTDREYGQGAIERSELAHREISRNVWLIRVPDADGPEAWQRRLNAAVDAKHGSFRVIDSSDDERRRVESGEITLQK